MNKKNNNKRKKLETYLNYQYDLLYTERPVSIHEFLSNDYYLGKLTGGGKAIYPVWQKELKNIAREDSRYLTVLTGAIGVGKTGSAILGMIYIMYRLLLLKDPWAYFGLKPGGKMSVVFFNLTKSLGESEGFNLLQSHLLKSPWFLERGIVTGHTYPKMIFPLFEYKLGSPYAKGFGTISSSVILALMDEVDSPTESDKQRARVLKAYENTVRRFESRFVIDGRSLGRFFLVASKQEQMSFLNTFIIKMQNSKKVYVVDIPIWEAKPATNYSGKTFPVVIGDLYTPSRILGPEDNIEEIIKSGFKIMKIPIEYRDDFVRDIVGALRDLGGVSVSYVRKSKLFPSEKFLVNCYDPTKKDPIKKLTVVVGFNDNVNLLDYFDLSNIRIRRIIPRYIHVDIAFSGNGDALGVGMSCVKGWKKETVEAEDGTFKTIKLPVVETDFALRLKAPPGDKIPLNKVRKMIIDLKNVYGFNIALCTFDHKAMSEDSIQILTRAGIKCDYFSVDRSPEAYRGFRDLVKEERWVCHRNEYLHFELVNLNDDPVLNKVDHPDEVANIEFLEDGNTREIVLKGSKDISDGVCGSVSNALKNCETPPDVEFMKKVFDGLKNVSSKERDGSALLIDTCLNKSEKKVEEKKNKAIDSFKDLFKRI